MTSKLTAVPTDNTIARVRAASLRDLIEVLADDAARALTNELVVEDQGLLKRYPTY